MMTKAVSRFQLSPVCPPPSAPRAAITLGIVGGGQLARMLAQAASQLGCDVAVIERHERSPAAKLATATLVGDWNDPAVLLQLGAVADVITVENEFVDADSLAVLERAGHILWPSAQTLRVVQDKLRQKLTLAEAGLPVACFAATPTKATVMAAGEQFGWPMLLKKRRDGYDGKGNVTLRSDTEIDAAWLRLDGNAGALYVEQFCPYTEELATIVCCARDGNAVCPVAGHGIFVVRERFR